MLISLLNNVWGLMTLILVFDNLGCGSSEPRKFPPGFMFGAATSPYQSEGAWNVNRRSESIWDYVARTDPCSIKDCSSGNYADSSYNFYKRDVEMMRELGLDFYRFSLSWTRILPTSFPNKVDNIGVKYYNNLIDEMLKYNITPLANMYHWDLPQKLQDMGGWTNPHIITWFGDYARVAFELFGDRVKYWTTINEPHLICHYGYGSKVMAPRLDIPGIAEYLCSKNVLLAHAKAYHIYNIEYRAHQGGFVGISLDAQHYEPASEKPDDIEAADDNHYFTWEQYAHPIFSKTGDYPQVMKDTIATKSNIQGFPRSRLPEFTPEEVNYVQGSADFFGVNHYQTHLVFRNLSVIGEYEIPSFLDDLGVFSYQPEEWQASESDIIMNVPWGFYKLLRRIRLRYNNPTILITENGFATHGGLHDVDRVKYIRAYLNAMLSAIDEGSDIRCYTVWSLMDNFEWTLGYTERFGLYEVDYSDPQRRRTPRLSAFVYKEIIRSHALDMSYVPDSYVMTSDEAH